MVHEYLRSEHDVSLLKKIRVEGVTHDESYGKGVGVMQTASDEIMSQRKR